jgi:hypothetical protein
MYREFADTERRLHELLPPSTAPLSPDQPREPVLGADQVSEVTALFEKAREQWQAYIDCARDWTSQA